MKYAIVALLILFTPIAASAQKDVFWADGGMCLSQLLPGASATYNYNVGKHLGLGAGCQLYEFHVTEPEYQYVPALYWDVRFNMRLRKRTQYFVFLDLGINLYKQNGESWNSGDSYYYVQDDNGMYTGFGIGYFRPKSIRGSGHYVTLKLISNSYNADAYNYATRERGTERWGDQTVVVSFGFKFK